MSKPDAERLTAARATRAIHSGHLSSEALVERCIARIDARDDAVHAWAHLEREHALAQARQRDHEQAEGREAGPLHGVPIGIKDIFDTADMPTECGSPIHAGHRPDADSGVVELLRLAGAVILGKTVTTEFAMSHPGPTRNPLALERTPGGSSSGSAAAVADFMVPLALGSQTVGSTIRPGSFCGIYAYKPTLGSISRRGMHLLSRRLDHVGLYGRSLEDLALLGDVLMLPDPKDRDCLTHPFRGLSEAWQEGLRRDRPRFAFVRSPAWEQADVRAQRAYEEFADSIGEWTTDLTLPAPFERASAVHLSVLGAWLAKTFSTTMRDCPERLSDTLRGRIEQGIPILGSEYLDALEAADALAEMLDEILRDYDAIVTPAAPGIAPAGLATTGNAAFNSLWTLCGAPALNLPLIEGEHGLPLGVQLVGRRLGDAALMRAARWLDEHCARAD